MNQLLTNIKSLLKRNPLYRNFTRKLLWRIFFRSISKKISGDGNKISLNTNLLWRIKFSIFGCDNYIFIAEGAVVKYVEIYIRGSGNRIYIDNNVVFKTGLILIEGSDNNLMIGAETTIEQAEFHITEKNCSITIGHDCMLSKNIIFRNGDSHAIFDKESGIRLNKPGSISIGDHVWIGQDVLLLKNSSIPSGSVIGAKSLVTKAFNDECSILAGNPAKIVRSNILWIRERE